MRGGRLTWGLVIGLIAGVVALVPGAGVARACTCAAVEPVSAIESAEAVFIGTPSKGPGSSPGFPTYTFEVDSVVKGEVPESFEISAGQTIGCGPDYPASGGPYVVYLQRQRGQLGLMGCAPLVTGAEFRDLVEADPPVADGEAAALASGRLGRHDLVVLDASGTPLGYAFVGAAGDLAHCAGSPRAVVVEYGQPATASLLDMSSFEVTAVSSLDAVSSTSTVDCIDGGRHIVVSGDGWIDDGGSPPASYDWEVDRGGHVVVSIDTETGEMVHTTRDVASSVVHRSGSVFVLPAEPGEPIEVLAVAGLEPLASVPLPAGTATIDGAISPDRTKLAVLATIDGTSTRRSPGEGLVGGTDVLVFDIVDGVPAGEPDVVHVSDSKGEPWPEVEPGVPVSVAPADTPGALHRIAWVDDATWLLDESGPAGTRVVAVVNGAVDESSMGSACRRAGVRTGTGLLCLDDGAVMFVGEDGAELPYEVMRPSTGRVVSLTGLTDAPEIELSSLPVRPLDITPIDEVGYDTGAAAEVMRGLLASDRRAFDDSRRSDGQRWAGRIGIGLVIAAVVAAIWRGLWLVRRRVA